MVEKALARSKINVAAHVEALIDRMGLGLLIWRLEDAANPAGLKLLSANPAATRIANFDYSCALGKTMEELFPSAVARGRHTAYAGIVLSGIEQPLQPDVYAETGGVLVAGRIVPLPNGCVAIIFENEITGSTVRDESKKLTAFLDSIVDNIPAMVFVKDAEHLRYELFNRMGERLSGFAREDILGKGAHDLFPKEQADFFQAKDRDVLMSGRMLDIPEEPIDYAGGRRWLHTKKIPILGPDGTPAHLLGISLDITDRKMAVEALRKAHEELEIRVLERTRDLVEANAQLTREIEGRKRTEEALGQAEEQLRHAQKMEAVGKLAGGIAHDFNNLLSVIISYATILSSDVDADGAIGQGLAEIKRAGERAADLTRHLLAFGRQQVLAPRVVDLNEVVSKMDRILRRLLGEDLELRTVAAADLGRVRADPGQLEQVIMNLAVNARDAMPLGGKLTIATANLEVDERAAKNRIGITPGAYVTLSVTDTGAGIDRATLPRIFEPFFTTKAQGKGTGLGLSTVFGIVKQSGGHIEVESERGRGTTFKIYLARTDDASTAEDLSDPGDASEPSLRGGETILLVEDEEQVRTLARGILEGQGYQVLVAREPSDALAIHRGTIRPIDLLITDIVMPQMNGRRLSEYLLSERPQMAVLLMSGYADDVVNHGGLLDPDIAFLQKPITPLALIKMVRQVLDSKGSPAP
jgi:two-component system cell cycle sensor histidine kinase/response regulator CckA